MNCAYIESTDLKFVESDCNIHDDHDDENDDDDYDDDDDEYHGKITNNNNSSWIERFTHNCSFSGGFGQGSSKESSTIDIVTDELNADEMKYLQSSVATLNNKKHGKPNGTDFFKEWIKNLNESTSKVCLEDFYLESANFKQEFLKHWRSGDDLAVARNFFRSQLSTVKNPYAAILHIIFNVRAPFMKGQTNSLAYTSVNELGLWIENTCSSEQRTLFTRLLTPEVKLVAFSMAHRGAFCFLQLTARVFQLHTAPDNAQFKPLIEPLLERMKFKEAAQSITVTGLQSSFSIESVLFPLVAQNKLNVVDSYLCESESSQRALVVLLDSFLQNNGQHALKLAVERQLPDINMECLSKRSICKYVKRLVKTHSLEHENLCPNVIQTGDIGGLTALIYRCFFSREISLASFREQMHIYMQQDDSYDSQKKYGKSYRHNHLIDQLLEYRAVSEARYWAENFGWSEVEMPQELLDTTELEEELITDHEIKEKDDRVNSDDCQYACNFGSATSPTKHFEQKDVINDSLFMKLPFPVEEVVVVDSYEKFMVAVEQMTAAHVDKVGLDTEWRSNWTATHDNNNCSIAILQVATRSSAWLMDIPNLLEELSDSDWILFGEGLMSNDKILKLGYGLLEDLRSLWRSVPILDPAFERVPPLRNVIELQAISKNLMVAQPEMFVGSECSSSNVRGLSELTLRTLGSTLNKSEQLSNWERRPLRREQVEYAALDALILVLVHDKLEDAASRLNIDIDESGLRRPGEFSSSTAVKKKRISKKGSLQTAASKSSVTISPMNKKKELVEATEALSCKSTQQRINKRSTDQVTIVTDCMFNDLGQHLRICGLDCELLPTDGDHLICAQIARRDSRIVLTCGAPFEVLRAALPKGRVVCLNAKKSRWEELLGEALRLLHLRLSLGDLMKRCELCNCDNCVKLSTDATRLLLTAPATAPAASNLTDWEQHLFQQCLLQGVDLRQKLVRSTTAAASDDEQWHAIVLDYCNTSTSQAHLCLSICRACGVAFCVEDRIRLFRQFVQDENDVVEDRNDDDGCTEW